MVSPAVKRVIRFMGIIEERNQWRRVPDQARYTMAWGSLAWVSDQRGRCNQRSNDFESKGTVNPRADVKTEVSKFKAETVLTKL